MSSADYSAKQTELPKQFVRSLKVLFDILDESNSGYVLLSDIETRWKGFNVTGLPQNILEVWRSLALPDTRLNFDRFITGIHLAFTRQCRPPLSEVPMSNNNNNTNRLTSRDSGYRSVPEPHPDLIPGCHSTAPGRPYHGELTSDNGYNSSNMKRNPSAGDLEWSSAMAKQRTFSMPQLPNVNKTAEASISKSQATNSKENVVNILKMWQLKQTSAGVQPEKGAGKNEPRSSVSSMSALDYYSDTETKRSTGVFDDIAIHNNRRRIIRKPEGRRHTVSSGIDFEMVKKMRKLKQDEGMLIHGIEMLNKAHQWYEKQMKIVQEKQKYLDSVLTQGSRTAGDEDFYLPGSRIAEVNHQLNLLIHSADKVMPGHMIQNVAGQPDKCVDDQSDLVRQLKEDNKQLMLEVNKMAEKIKKLEQEKTQVIREMFHNTSKNRYVNREESSYI